ncbi:MAG: hypothetical protein SGPRY_006122, partial [Prymnesium sp.]
PHARARCARELCSLKPSPLFSPRMAEGAQSLAFAQLREAGPVIRVSDGSSVSVTEEWGAKERAVMVFFRSFG